MIDVYVLSVIGFFIILGVLIYRDRKNIEFKYILLIRRTKKGKKYINKIAEFSPKFWKIASTIAIVFCIYIMFSTIISLVTTLRLVIVEKLPIPILQFIVPVPTAQPISGPGYIAIPFWFWIIVIPFVLFPHELSHGIILRAEKIRLSSVGLLLLTILPGAFVEPDEKQLEKSKLITKLRVFSSGSAANFMFAFILLMLTSYFVWPFFVSPGLLLAEVNETSPAGEIGLRAGMVIQKIDGKKIDISFDDFGIAYGLLIFSQGDMSEENIQIVPASIPLVNILKDYKPNDTLSLMVDGKNFNLTLGQHPENSTRPYIGILPKVNGKVNPKFAFSVLFPVTWLCIILSWGVASFNILPIYPLDGGMIVDGIMKEISKKYRKKVVYIVTFLTLCLVISSIILPIFAT